MMEDGALILGQIGDVIVFMDVAQVGKDVCCRGHIFIEIVEIGKQQLSPAIEMVQGLTDACTLREALMEVADQFDGVGHLSLAVTAEKVTDGDVGGTPDRFSCQTCQMLVEEKGGSFVREDHCDTGQVGTVFPEQVSCYVFEETLHAFTSSILLL